MSALELPKILLLLLVAFAFENASCESSCYKTKILETECASYCYEVSKPLLQMAPECYRKDAEISRLKDQLAELKKQLTDQLAELKKQLAVRAERETLCISQRQTVSEIKTLFDKCTAPGKPNAVITAPKPTIQAVVNNEATKVTEVKPVLTKLSPETTDSSKSYPDNCEQSIGIQTIQVAGIAKPFQVLCDNATNDFPWIVMQRRVNRAVDFNQKFVNYTNGFGHIDGSHFIGLERIYRLTNTQPYELYIHLEAFDGTIGFARYNNFMLEKSNYYQLRQLGTFTGNVYDAMSKYLGSRFSTFDLDKDFVRLEHCAAKLGAGWWYNNCNISSNLNGRYADFEIDNAQGIWWKDFNGGRTLKLVKMLIRPAHW